MQSATDIAFVYVHIGENRPQVLTHYPALIHEFYPNSRLVLLTDYPKNWYDFPGQVIDIGTKLSSLMPLWAKVLHYDYLNVANGYWKKTLLRLFILGDVELAGLFGPNELVIHLESDILVMACEATIKAIKGQITSTSIIKLSEQISIGALIVAPNFLKLALAMQELQKIFFSSLHWKNDMELLHAGLNLGVVQELKPFTLSNSRVLVFDGAPFGQYLFGQDPLHLGGFSQGGFLSPFRTVAMDKGIWRIESCDQDLYLRHHHVCYEESGSVLQLFNLHMHSKLKITNPDPDDADWKEAVDAANRLRPFPAVRHNPSLYLHAANGNIRARTLRKIREVFARQGIK